MARSTRAGGRGPSGRDSPHSRGRSGTQRGRRGRRNSGRGAGPSTSATRNGRSDRGGASFPPPVSRTTPRAGHGGPGGGRGGDGGARGRGRGRAGGGDATQPQTLGPFTHHARSGGGGGAAAAAASGSSHGRGGATHAGKTPYGQSAVPTLYGMANQFLFVELEKDGVWKVSVPDGQRFGKSFLAGLEVWARQLLAGDQPVLRKSLAVPSAAAAASTASITLADKALTFTPPAAITAAPWPSAMSKFVPPPPSRPSALAAAGAPGGTGLGQGFGPSPLAITSLTGSGLPGLDTLGLVRSRKQQSPPQQQEQGQQQPQEQQQQTRLGVMQPLPKAAAAAAAPAAAAAGRPGDGRNGGGAAAVPAAGGVPPSPEASAMDFLSLLQAQLGIATSAAKAATAGKGGGGGSSGGGDGATSGSGAAVPTALVEDNFTSIIRTSAITTTTSQQPQQEPSAADQEPAQGLASAAVATETPVAEEYRGLLADLDAEAAGKQDEVRQPYEHEDLEEDGEKAEEESFYGDSQGGDDYQDEETEEEEGEEDESYDDEGDGYFDDYEDDYPGEKEGDSGAVDFDSEVDEHDPVLPQEAQGPTPRARGGPASLPLPRSPLSVAAAGQPPPPPPPRTPTAAVAATGTSSSLPLSLELLRRFGSLDAGGRVRVSLRLERQLLNDTEVEMLADWYRERASGLLELSKLWLYDNRISDRGAAAVARGLLHPALLELHLSHNVIGDAGAAALVEALPAERPAGLRPLWLRLEWNVLNVEALMGRLEEQRAARGLNSDVPQVEPSGGGAVSPAGPRLHDHKLVLGRGSSPATVRLPWVACQKQPPSEAGVLRTVKDFYSARDAPSTGATATAAQPPVPPSTSPAFKGGTISPPPASTPPSPPPAAAAPPPRKPATAKVAATQPPLPPPPRAAPAPASAPCPSPGPSGPYAPGPLLLFPDTSALISMLGGNTALLLEAGAAGASTSAGGIGGGNGLRGTPARWGGGPGGGCGRPALDWGLLLSLAAQGRFGRALPLHDQVFVVVADSVMKQLDGLKSLPETRAAVRRFMSEGLEQAGPAGYDFLTVLGAHEGEGLALAGEHGGLLGLAGSRSPWLASRGQAVDVRIVEVALFYQAEVTRAYQQSGGSRRASGCMGGGEAATLADAAGEGEAPASPGAPASFLSSAPPRGPPPAGSAAGPSSPFLPVILLSNDNAQISAAKSHGLPAFRLSSAGDLATRLEALASGGSASLTSGVLRQLLAPQATLALGTIAARSLQDQFDCAVGTLRGVVAALRGLLPPLERIGQLAAAVTEPSMSITAGSVAELEAKGERPPSPHEKAVRGNPSSTAGHAAAALREIRTLLLGRDDTSLASRGCSGRSGGEPDVAGESASDGGSAGGRMDSGGGFGGGGLVPGLTTLLTGLQCELVQWEGVIRTHQAPSRLVQWAALQGPTDS